jgi:spermidine synthase
MKPWVVIGRARTPDGTELTLTHHVSEYIIQADGQGLMSSRMHASEDALAVLGCADVRARRHPSVLVGGLGLGFTLRAALDVLPADASVLVAELVPEVIEWNRGPLGPCAGHPLDDPRVEVQAVDVAAVLRASRRRFDAVLLDVDNGADAFTDAANCRLYDDGGIAALRAALTPGGVLALWSLRDDTSFQQRLRARGFRVVLERVRARGARGGARHSILLAHLG